VDAKNAPSCGTTVEAPFPNPALGNTDKFPPFSVPETRGQGSSLSRQLNATGDPAHVPVGIYAEQAELAVPQGRPGFGGSRDGGHG